MEFNSPAISDQGTNLDQQLAGVFEQEMERQHKTKQAMAKEFKTSRSQLDRLLDPQNTAVSIETLSRAARVLGNCLASGATFQQASVPLMARFVSYDRCPVNSEIWRITGAVFESLGPDHSCIADCNRP